jgi:hypothetical protein
MLTAFGSIYAPHAMKSVAKFIVPDWRDKAHSGIGGRTGLPGNIGWRADTISLCRSQLYPPSQ